jgi:hypothetical protein
MKHLFQRMISVLLLAWGAMVFAPQHAKAEVISSFPYVNSFETAADLNGWTLVGASRTTRSGYDGSQCIRIDGNTGYVITPELNLAALQNPHVSFMTYSTSDTVYVSANGSDFTQHIVNSNCFTIPKTTKFVKVKAGSSYSYLYLDKFTIQESPVISSFPYVNSFETEADLNGWTLAGASQTASSSYDGSQCIAMYNSGEYVITPELNLTALQNPHVSFMTTLGYQLPYDTVYVSANGSDFTQHIVNSKWFTIPKTTKFVKVKRGSSTLYLDKFTIQGSPVISSFPYVNSFETAADLNGWTLSGASQYASSNYDGSQCISIDRNNGYVISPELDLAALQNPHVSFMTGSTSDTVYVSANGSDFTQHIVNSNWFTIPKTTKFVKVKAGSSILYLDKFTIQENPVISSFPYVNSFETAADLNGWTLSGARQTTISGYDGSQCISIDRNNGYVISPELNLAALQNPHVSFMTNSTSDTVYVSANGSDFTQHIVNSDCFTIPKTTKFVKVKAGSSYLYLDKFTIQESPVISSFPYIIRSFNTETLAGWVQSVGTSTSPRLNLTGKLAVQFSGESDISFSEDGNTFTPQEKRISGSSRSYAVVPENARYIRLQSSTLSYFSIQPLFESPNKDISELRNLGAIRWVPDGDGFRIEASGEEYSTILSSIYFYIPPGALSYSITYTLTGMDADKVSFSGGSSDGTYTISGSSSLAIYPKSEAALQALPDLRISNIEVETTTTAIPSINALYDTDGDGKKELIKYTDNNLHEDHFLSWEFSQGNTYTVKDTLIQPVAWSLYRSTPLNINNDDQPDFGASQDTVYISTPEGYRKEVGVNPRLWDVNADGRPDLYSEETEEVAETQRYIHYQQPDGSFRKSRIEFVSTEEWLELLRNKKSPSIYDMSCMSIIGSGVSKPSTLDLLETEIDFNRDGLPDLMSEAGGGVLLNMGNNRFAFAQAKGQVFAKDLNNDGLSDIILYDEDAQTVTTRIYLGEGEVKEQVVLRNFKISDVWCYDFDKDGDVDILIPLNYQSSIGYAFLIGCENQGAGKFKVHENYYDAKWTFSHCADVTNDGYFDLIATNTDSVARISGYYQKYYLFEGKTGFAFNAPKHVCTSYYSGSDKLASFLQDLDNDGVAELVINQGSYIYGYSGSYIYKFKNITPNQRPHKPAAPAVALNRETGKLKISWQTGSDAESSAVDLTYSLRIGSAPGKSDVWFPYANPDGSRITFTAGNMGANLDKLVDVSGWTLGDYYISIQTVDPNFSGSAFSDEVVYSHTPVTPKFTLSDSRIFTVDTLAISLAGSKLAGYDYRWNIPDGQIIEENDLDLKVIFSLSGEKTITLQVTGANGETLPAYEQEIAVLPNKVVKSPEDLYIQPILDMDGNGAIDGTASNGLFFNNGQGTFAKIPKLYNSDLTASNSFDEAAVMDMNMDGWPDLIMNTNKGGVLINQGDLSFEILNMSFPFSNGNSSRFFDLNNDGYLDYYLDHDNSSSKNGFYKYAGNDRSFEKISNLSGDWVYDWNDDGLWDIIASNKVYINKGSFLFEPQAIEENYSSYSRLDIKDMNNDGFPDLILQKWGDNGLCVAFGNKENRYENPRELGVTGDYRRTYVVDIDNNGFPDVVTLFGDENKLQIAYFYPDGEIKTVPDAKWERFYQRHLQDTYYYVPFSPFFNDLTGDHIPDFSSSAYHQTKITNTPPQTPANVRARQTDTGLLIEWDAAYDAETPYEQMRYNVSVKKSNAALGDENAFIVSPLNALKDEAAVVPHLAYRTATRMEIPMERTPAGSYEIQVQSIDLWNVPSPLSAPFTIETSTQVGIQAESHTCVDVPITVLAHSTEVINENTIVWNWDGGVTLSGSGAGPWQVQWTTPGVKTIRATVNGVTASTSVLVGQGEFYDLTFSLPTIVLADVDIVFELPEILTTPGVSYHYNVSNPNISVSRRNGTRECKAVFPASGGSSQWIELEIEGGTCASPTYRQTVTVKTSIVTPKISLVNIDAATGKNRIIWDKNNVNLTPEVTEMVIYREGSKYNQFTPIGSVTPATGEFIDLASNPQITTSRYRIAYNTIYSAQSNQSIPHRSTHLMLNRGMGSIINLCWTQYEGGIIESYRIYRGETPETLSLLAEVSGNTNSYTDMTPPSGLFYYAIEYDQTYNPIWTDETVISYAPAMRSTRSSGTLITGRSNAVSVVNAQNITFAQSLSILALEDEISLSPAQDALHLFAEIFPVTADYKTVNWLIISGADYAYINQQGVLRPTGNAQSGWVTVRATTIDGSNIYRDITVPVAAFGTGFEPPAVGPQNRPEILLYPNPVRDELRIAGCQLSEGEAIMIYDLSGRVVMTTQETVIPVSRLSKGVYFLKAGNYTGKFVKE